MNPYHEMYLTLASATADAIDALQSVTKKLIGAQWQAEEILLRRTDKTAQKRFDAAQAELQAAIKTLLPPDEPAEQR